MLEKTQENNEKGGLLQSENELSAESPKKFQIQRFLNFEADLDPQIKKFLLRIQILSFNMAKRKHEKPS